jgi:hypothetical protein
LLKSRNCFSSFHYCPVLDVSAGYPKIRIKHPPLKFLQCCSIVVRPFSQS